MREPIKIGEVAELIGPEIVGDPSVTFASIGSLASAGKQDLSYLSEVLEVVNLIQVLRVLWVFSLMKFIILDSLTQ